MAQYLNKTGLTTLWTKIKYTFALKSHTHKKSEITDLTIPTVNNPTITINQGGVKKGSFSLNQSGAATIDLTDNDTTYSTATQSSDGLMSAADKKKLEGIAEGANKITVDSALSLTSTNPVQNKVIKNALDGKAGSSHSHSSLTNSSGRVFNVPTGGSGGEQKTLVITDDLNAYQPAGNYASASHNHAISDITGLYDELTGMTYVADSSNNSVQLETYGDGNSFSIPTKGYVDNALNGKSNLDHNHDSVYQAKGDYATNDALKNYVTGTTFIDYTTYIEGEVNKKANVSHSHEISNVNGLQSALDGKSNTGHGHTISDITNLQSTIESIYSDMGLQDEAIAGKADSVHTHTKSQITDFPTIPTVNNPTITINQGGTKKGSFSLNQSGAATIDLTDNNTWRGIQNNLTSDSTTDSLSAAQGKALANGSARDSTKLPLAGGTLNGTLGFKSNYLIKPVADFRTQSDRYTGAITIALPASISNTMVSMWIDVYNYSTNTSFSVHVGGYTYTNSTWQHNPFAMVYGATHTIRLGHNGTNFVIYIGETNSTWNYPQISVRDVILGHQPAYDNWKKDWAISFSTSFSNVSATINHYAWTTKNFTPPTSLPANGGNADTLDGSHASSFAHIGADNNLLTHTDEFTFASSGFSGAVWLNYRTAGGTNGNITEYKLGNGAGGLLGTIIHSGNIGSQNVNYANSAGSVAWGNVTGKPSTYTPSAHDHTSLKSNTDNRNSNTTPNDYNGILNIAGLKGNDKIGLDTNVYGTYSCLIGVRGWGDSSGGNAHELAFTGNGHIAHRHGSTTSWGGWDRIAHASDIPTKLPASNISMSSDGTTLTITYS